MKRLLFYIVLLLQVPVSAQYSLFRDTIEIPGVTIRSFVTDNTPSGYKVAKSDSALLKSYSYGTVADVMALSSPVFIKTYGNGGTATPSFRGTGASNTLVAWNGIRIDHPMLGQTDLSLLPAAFTDEMNVYFGGASMPMYSGAPGGIISIETKPQWENVTSVTIIPGNGSFGKYSGTALVRTGSKRFYSSTKAFYLKARNDFPYINTVSGPEPFREIRRNSEVQQQGIIQEFYYRSGAGVLSAHFWYQDAGRNLPSPVIAQTPGQVEKQEDNSLRSLLNYDVKVNNSDFSFTGAWVMNRLDYYNKLASVNSRNRSDMLIFKASLKKPVGKKLRMDIGLNEELTSVNSNNYESVAKRNSADLMTMISDNGSGRFGGTILLREILCNNSFITPDFSTGIKYRLSSTKEYSVSANFSKTSRIPTMNDLFWSPGGNRELKNENATVCEVNYRMKEHILTTVVLDYSLSAFRNSIHDMIQWLPGEYSYWSPVNIGKVRTAGFETSVSASYRQNKFETRMNAGYSFTEAFDNGQERRKQLMYVPEHMGNASLSFIYGRFHSSWNMSMNGKRFVTIDNSRSLPGYSVHRISTGLRFEPSWGILDLGIDIDNLFDKDYETVAYYPLPGRSYFFKVMLQITNLK